MPQPNGYPIGWFQVAWSADIAKGEVKKLHYFGRDLVAFRGNDGALHVLDAYCQHLGANLAVGGCVVDDGIQCPFHGWVWDGQGRNVRIPYESRPNRGRRVRSWPVSEINEGVFVWHHPDAASPTFSIPETTMSLGDHISARKFHPVSAPARFFVKNVRMHPQVVAENAVDAQHFRYVHGTAAAPVVLNERTDDSQWLAKVGFGRRWQDGIDRAGDYRNTLIIRFVGLGVSYNGEMLKDGARITGTCPTPVDETHTDIFNTYWIDETFDNFEMMCQDLTDNLLKDCKIWDNQIYLSQPGLAASEVAGFRKLRDWATRFYPAAGTSQAETAIPVPS
jgi:3-ketosteroid 9alpha-monooxygenase subunit A